MSKFTSAADRDLITRIDAACVSTETAKAAWFDRSVELGKLLKEAKQRHPAVADFEAFLKETRVGINLRWAYECIAMAGDPKEAERLRTANKERVEKHREKKRLNKSKPEPKRPPEPSLEDRSDYLTIGYALRDAYGGGYTAHRIRMRNLSSLKEADRIYAKVRSMAEANITKATKKAA